MKDSKNVQNIEQSRALIDAIDNKILNLLAQRFELCKTIGKLKEKEQLPIVQKTREEALLKKRAQKAVKEGLDPQVIEKLFKAILKHSHKLQKRARGL